MKITIEVEGLKMVLTDDLIEDVILKTPMNVERCDCDCPVPCKGVHQRFSGGGTFELKGKLTGRPLWVDA
jgi:hypothetical protein